MKPNSLSPNLCSSSTAVQFTSLATRLLIPTVILLFFPTNKIRINLIKTCRAACHPVTVSTVESLHKYK